MRVTKTVKDYITEEVTKRIKVKYEAEAAIAKEQDDKFHAFVDGAAEAAKAAYLAYFEEHFHEVSDFCKDNRKGSYGSDNVPSCYSANVVQIIDRQRVTSVHQWQGRMHEEVDRTVRNIIVELELGGTKADLMKMLEKI